MKAAQHSIYLLRHGKIAGPAALYGRTDVPLSALGEQQVQLQLARLTNLQQVISSPSQRCLQTAQAMARRSECPLHIDDDWRECDFGRWDGVPFDQIASHYWPELEAFWQAPGTHTLPQAEPLSAMQKRVSARWQSLLKSTPQATLLVTHGGVIRLILCDVLGLDWRNGAVYSQWQIPYGSLTKITLADVEGAQPQVEFVALPFDWGLRA